MNIAQLPFNQLIGLEKGEPHDAWLVSLPAGEQYHNHLGTVHASALVAVAEAGSGEFLFRHFGHLAPLVPVVRKLDAKFRRPATGRVYARCTLATELIATCVEELQRRKRLLISIPIEVADASTEVVLLANVEWFISQTT